MSGIRKGSTLEQNKKAKKTKPLHPAIKRIWEQETRDPDLCAKEDVTGVLRPRVSKISISTIEDMVLKVAQSKKPFFIVI